MSVHQTRTLSLAIGILTLFAAAAWGQQKDAENPVLKSENAMFGSDLLVDGDGFFNAALRDMQKTVTAAEETPSVKKKQPVQNVSQTPYRSDESLVRSSSVSLVNKDGYFLAATNDGLWSDATTGKPPVTRRSIVSEVVETSAHSQTQLVCPSKLRLRVGFDALLFQRGRAENTIFATDDNGQDWAFSDFEFSEGTARYFIQYMSDDQSGFEFTFFDFNSFSSSIEASGENVVPFFFQGNPADNATDYDLNYTSRLKNIELNSWFRHSPTKRTGYGIRHINLDETFDVLSGGNIASGLFSRTDNDLWGLTRMWERRRPLYNRMTLIGGVDAGLYLNRVKVNVDTLNVDDSSEAKNLAGSLGFNVGLEYQVADNVTLRLGYEGLGLFGVGLASTQSLSQDVINGLDDPELSSLYFGGFNIGAIATF